MYFRKKYRFSAVFSAILAFIDSHKLFIVISLLYFLSRIIGLNNDYRLLESFERLIITSSPYKELSNHPLIGPGYIILLQFFIYLNQTLTPLYNARLLSVLGGYLLGLALYAYGYRTNRHSLGVVASLTFWLLPLPFFYSKTVIPHLLGLGIFLLGYVLQIPIKERKYRTLGGILCGISLSIMPVLVLLTPVFWFIPLLRRNKQGIRDAFDITKVMYITAAPFLGIYAWLQTSEVTTGTSEQLNLNLHSLIYHSYLPWYFSWVTFLSILIGGSLLFLNYFKQAGKNKKYWLDILKQKSRDQFIIILLVLGLLPIVLGLSPHGLLYVSPLIAFLTAFFLLKYLKLPLAFLSLLAILPLTLEAWLPTVHSPLKEALSLATNYQDHNYQDVQLYSTFDTAQLTALSGKPFHRLTAIPEHNAVVITDILRTGQISGNITKDLDERKQVWIYTDSYNNFPWQPERNILRVYLIP